MVDEKIISQELKSHGYVIRRKISSGSHGTVYKVHSLKYKSSFAAKIVQKFFEEEVECLCRLMHPNIVVPYQSFEGSGMFFIIMEYCKTSLKRTISENGALNQKAFLKVSSQLVDTLDYCLKHNILHCDIKSENVLIDKYGRVKLCDFGLAKIREQKDQLSEERYFKKVENIFHKNQMIHGTFDYLAPELLMKRTLNTEKSEVWSLGILFYECLAGCLPWIPTFDTRRQVIEGIVPIEELNVSSEITTLLSKMLQLNPKLRISMEELKTEILYLVKNDDHISFCKRRNSVQTSSLQNSFSTKTNQHRKLLRFDVHHHN